MNYVTVPRITSSIALAVLSCASMVKSHAQQAAPQGQAIALADAAWDSGNHTEAMSAYRAVLREDTAGQSRAVFRLATLLSWNKSLDEAIRLFGVYRRLEPSDIEGRVALARTLAWASRFDAAIAQYDSIVQIQPAHQTAALSRAQTLAWAGRMDDAERSYSAQLGATGSVEAAKGLARLAGWRGDFVRSEALWLEIVERNPADAEALTGLAQVQRWAGNPRAARESLRLALLADSAYPEARTQQRWVKADLAPSITSSVSNASDNDGNRATLLTAVAGFTPRWNGRLFVAGSYREASLGVLSGKSIGARAKARWAPARARWNATAEVGATRLSSQDGDVSDGAASTHLAAALGLALRPVQRLTVGLSVSRAPFDETAALIARGVVTSELNADYDVSLPSRLSLSGAVGYAALSGDGLTRNSRLSGSGALRWQMKRAIYLGVGARTFSYDTTTADGYFAPKGYMLVETLAGIRIGGDVGFGGSLDAGVGRQQIRLGSRSILRDGNLVRLDETESARFAQRIAASVRYTSSPGFEWVLSGGFANVASPTAVSEAEYRAFSLMLGGRIRL